MTSITDARFKLLLKGCSRCERLSITVWNSTVTVAICFATSIDSGIAVEHSSGNRPEAEAAVSVVTEQNAAYDTLDLVEAHVESLVEVFSANQ